MTEMEHPPVPLKRERDEAIEALVDHYAADNLTVEEYESRLDLAYAATTTAELEDLLSGLPDLASTTDHPSVPSVPRAPAATEHKRGYQIAVLGAFERKGEWVPPRKMRSFAMMGSAGLDFREARMLPGVTEVHVTALMGYIEILVPPGLAVQTHGFGVLGGFEEVDQAAVDTNPDAPRLVIRGKAIMGYVEVSVRLPGESAPDAKR